MPGMDGFETAKHIKQRERTRHIPILFLTAADYDAHLAFRGYQAGAVDYLTKPFDPWVLRAKVAVFVDLYLLHTEVTERAAERDALRKGVDEALAAARRRRARRRRHLDARGTPAGCPRRAAPRPALVALRARIERTLRQLPLQAADTPWPARRCPSGATSPATPSPVTRSGTRSTTTAPT